MTDTWLQKLCDLIEYDTFCDEEDVDGELTMRLTKDRGTHVLTVTYKPFEGVPTKPAAVERYRLTKLVGDGGLL